MLLRKLVVLLLMVYAKQINCSFYGFDDDKADWDIFNQQKQWNPIITSGPTILISSNITSVYDQNGDPVEFQLSNNNVGIGKRSFYTIKLFIDKCIRYFLSINVIIIFVTF